MKQLLLVIIFTVHFPSLAFGLEDFHSDFSKQLDIPILVYEEHKEAIIHVLASTDCKKISNYQFRNQIVAEAILLCQLLKAGGIVPNFQWKGVNSKEEALSLLESEKYALSAFTHWKRDLLRGDFYISKATLPKGDFVKGIYTSLDNERLLNLKNIDEIIFFRAVTNPAWELDIETLNCMNATYITAVKYKDMLDLVQGRWVDYMLHNIANDPQLRHRAFGKTLVPVPGYKVVFSGSLHYGVNKKNSLAIKIYDAIESGITQFRKIGKIKKAYKDSAFYNPEVESWKNLGCPESYQVPSQY